nr:hypothetical protein CFP56_07516 [Quercus suber]
MNLVRTRPPAPPSACSGFIVWKGRQNPLSSLGYVVIRSKTTSDRRSEAGQEASVMIMLHFDFDFDFVVLGQGVWTSLLNEGRGSE